MEREGKWSELEKSGGGGGNGKDREEEDQRRKRVLIKTVPESLSPVCLIFSHLSHSHCLLCPHLLDVPEERDTTLLTGTAWGPLCRLLAVHGHVPHPYLALVITGDELACVAGVEQRPQLATAEQHHCHSSIILIGLVFMVNFLSLSNCGQPFCNVFLHSCDEVLLTCVLSVRMQFHSVSQCPTQPQSDQTLQRTASVFQHRNTDISHCLCNIKNNN